MAGLILLLLFLWTNDCQARFRPDHPRIFPAKDFLSWEQGRVLELICRHTNPNISWTFPKQEEWVRASHISRNPLNDSSTSYTEEFTGTYDVSAFKYVAVLRVTGILPKNTGYFYCSDALNGLGSQIYVYVRNAASVIVKSLIVEHHEVRQNLTVSAYLHQRFIIPCRPIHANVVVSLWKRVPGNDPVIIAQSDVISSGAIRFDPKVGFIFLNALPQHEGVYFCGADVLVPRIYEQLVSWWTFSLKTNRDLQLNIAPRTYITPPQDSTVVIGEDLTLTCEVFLDTNETLGLRWALPELTLRRNKSRISHVHTNEKRDDLFAYTSVLVVRDVTKQDEGLYYCISQMNGAVCKLTSVRISVIKGTSASLVPPESTRTKVHPKSDPELMLETKVNTLDPSTEVYWTRDRQVLFNNMWVRVCIEEDQEGVLVRSWVKFVDVRWTDGGKYELIVGGSKGDDLRQEIQLDIFGVRLEGAKSYFQLNARGSNLFQCYAQVNNEQSTSMTELQWSFHRCSQQGKCAGMPQIVISGSKCEGRISSCSNISFPFDFSGLLRCTGTYRKNVVTINDSSSTQINVIRGFGPLVVEGRPWRQVVAGDPLNISCSASSFLYSQDSITWRHDGDLLKDRRISGVDTMESSTPWSYDQDLVIKNATEEDSGSYQCIARQHGNQNDAPEVSNTVEVTVKKSSPPRIISTQLNNETRNIEVGVRLQLDCKAEGWLEPDLSWYRENDRMERIELYPSEEGLVLDPVRMSDAGKYVCRATNQAGQAEAYVDIQMEGTGTSSRDLAIVLSMLVIIVLLLAMGIYLGRHVYIQRRQLRELAADLETFEKGSVDRINPDIPISDQAENLPYDPKWEVSRDKVTLGKQLGFGAFGVVYEAEAEGLLEKERVTKVAVKTVKPPAEISELRSLIAELKIMIHVGKNLNVVNILGACTRNLCNRELLVLVEYCKYGNIRDYLRRRRNEFIDELDESGKIARYTDPKRWASESLSSAKSVSSLAELLGKSGGKDNSDGKNKTTTTDLVSWSFQVARGMNYLVSKTLIHRDLAARNVLLAENNVVKICDFGLARETESYKKKGEGLLPIKWMAIESIQDRVFSKKSDIWSFGILLWEMFTLGQDPYPGVNVRDLLSMLVDGHRMSKPKFAPAQIYKVMLDCWNANSDKRPSFANLEKEIGSFLEEGVKKYYMSLAQSTDEPGPSYVVMRPSKPTLGESTGATSSGYSNVAQVAPDGYLMACDPSSSNKESLEMVEVDVQNVARPSSYLQMK